MRLSLAELGCYGRIRRAPVALMRMSGLTLLPLISENVSLSGSPVNKAAFCRGLAVVPVRGQELRQRRQHLLGGLLGDPVAGVGDDHALHVVRGGLHPVPDLFTQLSAPPIARTGIVSGVVLRCPFCARV